VLRRIFEQKRDKIIKGLGKLHIEDLHNMYFTPNIIIMIKSRRMRWTGYLARTGEEFMQAFSGKAGRKGITRKT
jgi:hypothetical protein